MNKVSISRKRQKALRLYAEGKLNEAIQIQSGVIKNSTDTRDDYTFLSLMYFTVGDYPKAIDVLKKADRLWPNQVEITKNIAVCLSRNNQIEEALGWFKRALEFIPHDATIHDGLAKVYGNLGELDLMRKHGRTALKLKDSAVMMNERARFEISNVPIPPFQCNSPERNIIAFSLWGNKQDYLEGAIENARLGPILFPAWRCRFYVEAESVPERIIIELLRLSADVVLMPKQKVLFEGLFWRFQAMQDQSIDRFLVRDADSILNIKEKAAIEEWLASDKHFHLLRDYYTHTDPILAGLWGGVAGILPDYQSEQAKYLQHANKTANCDQKFLREQVWPIIRRSVMIHDSVYDVLSAKPYPNHFDLPSGYHIGQNASVHKHTAPGRLTTKIAGTPDKFELKLRDHYIFTLTTGHSGTQYLANLLAMNLNNAKVHHQRTGYADYAVHTPDTSHLMLFNSEGNTKEVQNFWQRKFTGTYYGTTTTYAETSHFLAKAGLMENIPLLSTHARIDVVFLKRDVKELVCSIANRFKSVNVCLTWLLGLDPVYALKIVDPAPLEHYGMLGRYLWFVIEMFTRMEYYKKIMGDWSFLNIYEVDIKDLTQKEGALKLLRHLGYQGDEMKLVLPDKQLEANQWTLAEEQRLCIEKMLQACRFDPKKLALAYLRGGHLLSLPVQINERYFKAPTLLE